MNKTEDTYIRFRLALLCGQRLKTCSSHAAVLPLQMEAVLNGLLTVPTTWFCFFNYFASAKEVQNLSVVTFLPFCKHGSISCSTTLPESPREKGSNSSLPRYDLGFLMYFDSTSAANQNLIPNLLGLFAIYCVKRQRGFVRKNWLLTMIFSPGL